MTAFYNAIFGQSADAPRLVEMLGPDTKLGRFRDAWLELRDDMVVLAVYSRNGSHNREHYEPYSTQDGSEPQRAGIDCDCTGCIQTYRLPAHELYLFDEDDGFDSTYCTTYFRVPADQQETLRPFAVEPVDMASVWLGVIEKFKQVMS